MIHHTFPSARLVQHFIMSSNRRMPAHLLQQLVSSFVTQALQFDGDAATPPNAAMDTNNAAFLRPRPPLQRSHRLLDPADQLREVRFKLQTLMHDEYVETKDLTKVLNWSDEIRQKGINNTPLIDLIGMIVASSDSGANKRSLILPLYNALLCSPESKPFVTHAELYRLAIANIFRANSAPNALAAVQSFWSLFDLTPSTAYRTIPPGQLCVLRARFCVKYHVFLQELPIADFVRILPQLSTAIRQQSLFLSAPLAKAVDAVRGLPNLSKYRAAYAAFIGTAAERQMFAKRLHIYYPWMAEQLRHKRWFATKLGIVLCLIQKTPDVPLFLVDLLHQSLLAAFSWACATRNFSAADQIWQYRNDKIAAVIGQQQQKQRTNRSEYLLNFSTDFRFADVLAFTIHLWTNGNKMRAQHIMHSYLSRQFLLRNEHSKKYVNMMLRELNALDINYRQNLSKIVNGSNAGDEREKCHRNFVKAVHEKLTN